MVEVQPEGLLEYIIIQHRWVVVLLALLPMSGLWKLWSVLRNYVVFKMSSAPKLHDKKVKDVQNQVKQWLAGDRSSHMCTARPTWQTMSFRQGIYKNTFTNIRVNLVDILEVDTKKMTVRCEPLVSMGQLSRTLQPLGLALPVVPELDQLTVGGLVMGTGVETSSHVHGLFQHICLQYELVLADGSVLTCSKDENPDLFYAVPWSYGTLGFLASVVIQVIQAKKYVRVQYESYTNSKELAARFSAESLSPTPHQFVEALMFSRDSGVVMTADMVDEIGPDGIYNPIGRWYSEWFFKKVGKHLQNYIYGFKRPVVEYIPLRDYYHRHSKSLFWEVQDIVPFGNNFVFRLLFGWLMPPEVSLLKLTQPEAIARLYEKAHVLQDMLVPIECLKDAVNKFHQEFEVYPLWLCPFKVRNEPGMLRVKDGRDSQMFVDIGVYGVPKAKGYETVPSTRRIEQFVAEHRGFQMLYADTYTTREEFRSMFDHTLYDKVRDSLPHCKEAFPEVYGKVNRNVRK
ncbi:delta(24)-sterol reductase-like isoform X1 [Plodia interpunctella]|uniref:delta(24)-sterol reductase-like isoform X1 n=1 Tax=Plodia interpunctella TaxID=58824 RepID=UPI0023684960|nr:delta(24)-sterol reductase-like isoform X1 [Plodia interpunctella]XP_053619180.1 delta(24)-sterol reductase-like isoform X1 [Plodia interpunctella]XP_053619181.1 delta(24)-sterol reductase-like isoform X1 [Plodia interpunctella]